MPDPGQIVGGRYRLIRPLGEGGMASVWAAEHLTMGNTVALKIISPELVKHEVAIARFNREARAAAKLRSPYVVQIFDHDIDQQLGPYIAMELLEGESLAERLEHTGFIDPTDLVRIFLQVSKGLMRAHAAGIVHRDLKPDNIFLTVDEDDGQIAKVLDFGVAKADSPLNLKGDKGKTVAGTLLGTLNYMSPEQAQGLDVNHLTDLWAMGVIAFEALVGCRPFDEDAPGALVLQICARPMPVPSSHRAGLPAGFDAWFAKACSRDPAGRFQTAQELARALADTCDSEQLSLDDVLSFPVDRPISTDAFLRAPRPQPTPAEQPPASTEASRKRRVLEIVESIPPPAPPAEKPELKLQLVPSDAPEDAFDELEVEHEELEPEPAPAFAPPKRPEAKPVPKPDPKPEPRHAARPPPGPAARPDARMEAKKRSRPESRPAPRADGRPEPKARKSGAPEPSEFFVMFGADTVGPVSMEALRKGYGRGHLVGEALVWARGWSAWKRATEVLTGCPEPPRRAPTPDGILLVGPLCGPPPNAPAPPKQAAPVSQVRTAAGTGASPEQLYYVTDGALTVGPVRASILRRAVDAGKLAQGVFLWREGWDAWLTVGEVMKDLETVKPAPPGLLRNRPGIEAVGIKSLPPPTAPPSVAPNRRGQSN